jgi:hypothetical protein
LIHWSNENGGERMGGWWRKLGGILKIILGRRLLRQNFYLSFSKLHIFIKTLDVPLTPKHLIFPHLHIHFIPQFSCHLKLNPFPIKLPLKTFPHYHTPTNTMLQIHF